MISADWQIQVGGLVIGAGTPYPITGPVTGLGLPAPRTSDANRGRSPGDVAAADVAARRILTVPHGVGLADTTTADAAWTLYEPLRAAWAPTPVDVPFELRLPGFGGTTRRFYGRPRGLDDDLTLLRVGWIAVLGTFDALDPYAYGPELEVTLAAGDVAYAYPGSAATDRWTAELTPTGPTVTLANPAEGEPPLTLVDLTGPVTLDGRTRTVTTTGGADGYRHVAAGSVWPTLGPGAGTVTVTGAGGTLRYRPAHL